MIQGFHRQLWKSNVLYLWKCYTHITEMFVSRLPQLDIYYHSFSLSSSFGERVMSREAMDSKECRSVSPELLGLVCLFS